MLSSCHLCLLLLTASSVLACAPLNTHSRNGTEASNSTEESNSTEDSSATEESANAIEGSAVDLETLAKNATENVTKCAADEDCANLGQDYMCNHGYCMKSCIEDYECGPSGDCEHVGLNVYGFCNQTIGDDCAIDTDCAMGNTCRNGLCLPKERNS